MTVENLETGSVQAFNRTTPGVTPWIKLKGRYNPFECTLAITGDAAVANLDAKLEYVITNQVDPDSPALLPAAIVTHPNLNNVTGHKDDKLEWPASHVRMNVNTITGGSVNLFILQPGAA